MWEDTIMGFFFKRKSAAENQTAELHSSQYHEYKSKEEVYRILNSSYFYPLEKNDSYVFGTFPSPEEPVFSIIAYFKENQCFIKKSWPHIPGHSIGCSKHCVSPNNWIAFTIDTYYSQDPHSVKDLYLCDSTGKEKWKIHYEAYGARNYKYSPSGRYFIVLNRDAIYVYDTVEQQTTICYPEDIVNSASLDFDIDEEKKQISYKYTQHPDTPTYHFTFDGILIERDLFKEQVKESYRPSQRERELQNLWAEISNADRPLSIKDYDHFTAALLDFANDPLFADNAWIFRSLGELELELDHKQQALSYFEKALNLNSGVGVKRIATKLRKELSE